MAPPEGFEPSTNWLTASAQESNSRSAAPPLSSRLQQFVQTAAQYRRHQKPKTRKGYLKINIYYVVMHALSLNKSFLRQKFQDYMRGGARSSAWLERQAHSHSKKPVGRAFKSLRAHQTSYSIFKSIFLWIVSYKSL